MSDGISDRTTRTGIQELDDPKAALSNGQTDTGCTDEGHIITANPLLARYVVKITKMWRKLGAWFWIATQNLEDFPDASAPIAGSSFFTGLKRAARIDGFVR